MKDMLKREKNTKKENIETFFVVLYLFVTFGFRMLWKGLSAITDWLINGGPIVKVDGRRYKLVPFKILLVLLAIGGFLYMFAEGEQTCAERIDHQCVSVVKQ